MFLFRHEQWGMPNKYFWDRCVGDLFVIINCFILELPVLMPLDFCFLCLKLHGEGKVSSLIFRVIPTVKRYCWHPWMLLFSHKLLAVVRAIMSVVLQDSSTYRKLFSSCHVPCVICQVLVLGQPCVSTTLSTTACETDKKQTSHWGRVWYQESSTTCSLAVSLSFLLFNFSSMGWNISIYFALLYWGTLWKNC